MNDDCFDPNAFILPANKAERKRLANPGKEGRKKQDVQQKRKVSKRSLRKLKQLRIKAETEAINQETLQGLKQYRLSDEIAEALWSSTSLRHKQKPSDLLQSKFTKRRCLNEENVSSESDSESLLDNFTSLKSTTITTEAEENKELADHQEERTCESLVGARKESNTNRLRRKVSDNSEDNCHKSDRKCDRRFLDRSIQITRPVELEKQRTKLPAAMMEQEIVEIVANNDISIITGDTGCGKSTQVPQFLLEAGFCSRPSPDSQPLRIGITQPRRVAVMSVSHRIGEELNNEALVGYQVRYDKSINCQTCHLKLMTDGILLKEVQNDVLCTAYSVIILDEAHERSVNCDILIGLLSRSVRLRREKFNAEVTKLPPLRLVIMSATLRTDDFTNNTNLFPQSPPVLKIEARAHPVTLHFSRRTESNFIAAASRKVLQIHKQLPPGSVLVFVTGKREVQTLCADLKRKSKLLRRGILLKDDLGTSLQNGPDQEITNSGTLLSSSEEEDEVELNDTSDSEHSTNESDGGELVPITRSVNKELKNEDFELLDGEEDVQNAELILLPDGNTVECSEENARAAQLGFDSGHEMGRVNPKERNVNSNWLGCGSDTKNSQLKVVPLYALLSLKEQKKVFKQPKENERVVIVATNVAETSLTLPNIRYVVDCGLEKKKVFLSSDTASLYSTQWISKASSDQRAGRAGRIGPGHCYRLYSTAVYNDIFSQFPAVNLFTTPLDSVLLFMASLGIANVANFPFPNPPPNENVERAQNLLINLKALALDNKQTSSLMITPLGRMMSKLPIAPRYALILIAAIAKEKILDNSKKSKILERCLVVSCCALVSGWSIGNLINTDMLDNPEVEKVDSSCHESRIKKSFKKQTLTRKVILEYEKFDSDIDATLWIVSNFLQSSNKMYFCKSNRLNHRQLQEVESLYLQLFVIIQRTFNLLLDPACHCLLSDRNPTLSMALHECALLGFIDNVAVRCDMHPDLITQKIASKKGYYCHDAANQLAQGLEPKLFIHQSSVVSKLRPQPIFVGFSQIMTIECPSSTQKQKRFIRDCFPIDPKCLSSLESPLIEKSDFLDVPHPMYSKQSDSVVGFIRPKYVPLNIELPTIKEPLTESSSIKYVVFGKALLEGEVYSIFRSLNYDKMNYFDISKALLSNPADQSNPQVKKFIGQLESHQCSSKSKMKEIWSINKFFLKDEIRSLISVTCPKAILNHFLSSWPPAV